MFGLFSKVLDPVCRMKIDKDKSKFFLEYEGDGYYFCSENCKNKFVASPQQYVLREANGADSNCQPEKSSCCH